MCFEVFLRDYVPAVCNIENKEVSAVALDRFAWDRKISKALEHKIAIGLEGIPDVLQKS